jgi:hypothetical protein
MALRLRRSSFISQYFDQQKTEEDEMTELLGHFS